MKNTLSFSHFVQNQPLIQVADFATFDGIYPRVRPMILICHDGFFWLATGTADDKFCQVTSHPLFECLIHTQSDQGGGYTRFRGRTEVVQDASCKKNLWEIATFIQDYFPTYQDPGFALLKLHPEAGDTMEPGETIAISYDMK